MKIHFNRLFHFGSLAALVMVMFAVLAPARADVNQSLGANSGGAATVSSIGPNFRTWSLPLDTNLLSFISSNSPAWNSTNSQLVELATGMNYWDGQQWSPSVASFQAVSNGFAAGQTQHKVFLNGNLNIMGAVTVTTPDGTNLYSSPIAIGLYDAASGTFAVIGAITNCTGALLNSNQVVYQNAFAGVCADVIYTIDKGAFHQDVVLTGSINPADYNFPSNTTRIQIITELYNPPTPERIVRPIHVEQNQTVRNQMATPDLMDEMLGFGHFTFGAGRTYLIPRTSPQDVGAPVGKQLFNVNGRMLLVESVEYKYIWRSMGTLPACNPSGTNGQGALLRSGKGRTAYAAVPTARAKSLAVESKPIRPRDKVVAVTHGLVIDYTADISSMDDPTIFQSDTTYFIEGTVYCDGATTIEGGTVVKYPLAVGSFSSGASISMNSSLTLTTSSYRPAIFTAADDDSAGTKMNSGPYASYYNGNPGTNYNTGSRYGWPYLSLACSVSTLSHLNFFYAQEALYINGEASSAPMTIAHSQFVNCIQGIELDSGSFAVLTLNNCLIHNVPYIFTDYGSEGDAYYLCHCTLHQTTNFVDIMSSDSSPSIACTNCVLVGISNGTSVFTGYGNGFYNSQDNGGGNIDIGTYPFDSVLSGGNYLDPGSGLCGGGTTNIDPGLLADLRKMTTRCPAVVLSNSLFEASLILSPLVYRDTNGLLDLGYHYDPIDFLVNNLTLATNNTLTLTNGVVVATYGGVGFNLASNTIFQCWGTPLRHNYITQTRAVQESPDVWNTGSTYIPFAVDEATGNLDLRFTDVTCLPQLNYLYNEIFGSTLPASLLLQDCRVSGASFLCNFLTGDPATTPSMQFHNSVFERCVIYVADAASVRGSPAVNVNVDWFNNLFFGADVGSTRLAGSWLIRDNIFDSGYISDSSTSTITRSNNAYINMGTAFSGTENGATNLSSFAYLVGPLGPYYQPTNSQLLNQGSRTAANAGLYHYTIGLNEVKEGTNIVTIGPHYVALNGSGQPDDTGGSGIPDYLADSNGNGVYDAATDLSNWTTNSTSGDGITDLNKLLLGLNIKVNTSINPAWADTNGIVNLQVYTPLH